MNTIGLVIANQDPGFILLSKPVQNRLYCAILLYLFKSISSQELSDEFKQTMDWTGQECIDFRKALKGKGVIQKCIKMYTYARICGYGDKPELYEVSEEDAKWVSRMMRSKTEGAIKLRKACLKFHRRGYRPIRVTAFNKALARLPEELKSHLGKLVGRKLRFLSQSGQIGNSDTQQDLIEEGIYAVYKAYPEIETPLHMVNIAKTAIHNRAMNIIQEQTTTSRNRVVKNADGSFSGTLLSINAGLSPELLYATEGAGSGSMVVCNALMSGMDGRSVEGESPTDVNRSRELRLIVEDMVESMGPVSKAFLHLMMGEYDEGFSDYLGQDNSVWYARASREAYLEKARVYLNVPVPNARAFLLKLRERLADYRN